jgi:phosphate starvation-inducible membrane PsiE
MIAATLRLCARLFDGIEHRWESDAARRGAAYGLVSVFLVALVVIEAGRQGWLPTGIAAQIASSHFAALSVSFTLLLLLEVFELVLGLARSVPSAAGKQFEIMSLILARQSFKELTRLDEPIVWSERTAEAVRFIISDATGALAIFALLGLYYRILHRWPEDDEAFSDRAAFVEVKKNIALVLLLVLFAMAVAGVVGAAFTAQPLSACYDYFDKAFFRIFYTFLIFADVLIVLVSLRFSNAYHVVFRYFGFAVATVMIRLALTAPRIIDALLGVGTMVFALALTWISARLAADFQAEADRARHEA